MENVLVSWLGRTDLRAVTESDQIGLGPIAQAVLTKRYSRLELLCDCEPGEADIFVSWLQSQSDIPIVPHRVTLPSPTDFDAIYRKARGVAAQALDAVQPEDVSLTFHLSPGTPAMAAVWIILAKTRFAAGLIESSQAHGVRNVSVPFDISADFIPDLVRKPDAELTRLTAGLPPAAPAFDAIIHHTEIMRRIVARARRVAPRSIPVLIEGESGTGKELFARAIHQGSPRRDRPMVVVNCGAISPELIEAELFGHERGAFTGAVSARKGVFEAADGGTLFLDEIGELPPAAQVRLLRALQEGEVTRVGSTNPVKVDVRTIAATNRSLVREVGEGRFREDLFYRLAVAVVELPPLRDRAEDIGLLVDSLLTKVNEESASEPGYETKTLSVSARNLFLNHAWPGNVREMLNTLRRAAVWTPGDLIDLDDARDALLPCPVSSAAGDPILGQDIRQGIDLKLTLERVAKHYLVEAMSASGNNKARSAKLLGLGNATTLANWLRKYRVER